MGKPKRLRSNPKLPAREIKPPNRPSKFRQWSDVSMKEAMKAVHDGKMSINRAAVEHGVPPTTLKDRLSSSVCSKLFQDGLWQDSKASTADGRRNSASEGNDSQETCERWVVSKIQESLPDVDPP